MSKVKQKRLASTGRSKSFEKIKVWLPVFLMMLPGLAYFFINNYIPMSGIVVAFKEYNVRDGIWGSPWAQPLFSNFKYLFTSKDAFIITRNTLLYNFVFIIVNNVLGITLAIFISDVLSKRAKTLFQSSVLLPFLMSYVVVSYIVFALLSAENGMMNKTILPMLGKEAISWYSEPKYWPFILVITNAWKSVGYGCLIYIAGIASIDKSLYEAADLDGAGKWKQIKHVTLPSLTPNIIVLALMSVGRIFYSDFSLFFQVPLNSGALLSTTNVIDTYVYRALLQFHRTSWSAAAGLYQSIVGFALVLLANLLVRKFSRDNALF